MPTAVKSWCRLFPNFEHSWKQSFQKIYKTTLDNKLREFAFKILHKILVTNKELKHFKIKNEDICSQCMNPDSVEHTFLECPVNVKFYQEILSWFNTFNSTQINLSAEQILFQNYSLPAINDDLRRQLDLLILFIKKYIYSCKIKEINLNNSQFINKLKLQWKIENLIEGKSNLIHFQTSLCDAFLLFASFCFLFLCYFLTCITEQIIKMGFNFNIIN